MQDQLKALYYNPSLGLQGERQFYLTAKAAGLPVTQKIIKNFLLAQEVQQLHLRPIPPKHFFPIKANNQDHIWQIDLADFSRTAHQNSGVNFLMCVIDIWSRYAWVYPLKKKDTKHVLEAMRLLLSGSRKPAIIQCDNGTEFTSRAFKGLAKEHNIEMAYCSPGDKHVVGIVERFNQTIRRKIARYLSASGTTRYIDVLPQLVSNYNNSKHSSIGSTPTNPDAKFIAAYIQDREDKADSALKGFQVGDNVRYVSNPVLFAKGSDPKYSSSIHKITEQIGRAYILSDRDRPYKYYELAKIPSVETFSYPVEEKKTEAIIPKKQRVLLNKEGVDYNPTALKRTSRPRKPTHQLVDDEGFAINY